MEEKNSAPTEQKNLVITVPMHHTGTQAFLDTFVPKEAKPASGIFAKCLKRRCVDPTLQVQATESYR